MSDVFAFVLPLLISFSPLAFGAPCAQDLVETPLRLPRELKVSEASVAYLARVPEYAETLSSLAKTFRALDENNLATIARALNQVPVELTESVIWPLFSDQGLSGKEISELAAVLRKIPRHLRVSRTYDLRGDRFGGDDPDVFAPERLQAALRIEHYRLAVADLLRIKRVRDLYIKVMTALSPHFKFGTMTEADVSALENRLRRGSIGKLDVKLIGMLSRTFALDVANFFSSQNDEYVEVVDRDDFLYKMEDYLAQDMGVKNALEDIIALMDFHAFGTPLPLLPKQVFDLVVEDAKQKLLPLKAAYNQSLKEHRALMEKSDSQPFRAPSFELRLVDHFEPRPGPRFRDRKDTSTTDPELLAVEQEIAPNESLRSFTNFSDTQRPLSELRPDRTYKFWFLRDNKSILQKIRFAPDVVAWMNAYPKAGHAFLNALHLGRARETGQNGIKILGKHSAKYPGTVYELKIKPSYRGLLIFTEGEWQFIMVVAKGEAMRAAQWAAPL